MTGFILCPTDLKISLVAQKAKNFMSKQLVDFY